MPHYKDFIKAIGHNIGKADDKYNDFMANIGAGLVRSATGTAQGVSGLADLVTPGTGTSRVSQFLDDKAKGIDTAVEQNPIGNTGVYKAGQAAGDALQLFTGGAEAKAAEKGTTGISKVSEFLDNATPDVLKNSKKAIDDTADQLSNGNAVQRATGSAIKGITDPKTQAGIGVYTALQTGANASKGRDTDPAEVAKGLATNELFAAAAPAAGSLVKDAGGKVISTVRDAVQNGPAVKAAQDASGLTRDQIVDNHDAAHLNDFAHSDTAKPDDKISTIAQNVGLNPDDKDGIKSYLGQRNQFLDTHTAVAQGGYAGPGGRDAAVDAHSQARQDANTAINTDDTPEGAAAQAAAQANQANPQVATKPPTDPNAPAVLPAAPAGVEPTNGPNTAPDPNQPAQGPQTATAPPTDPNAPAVLPAAPPGVEPNTAAPATAAPAPRADITDANGDVTTPLKDHAAENIEQGSATDNSAPSNNTADVSQSPASDTPAPASTSTVIPPAKGSYGEASDELLGRTKYGQEAKDEQAKGQGSGVREQLKEQFYDRFSPINNLVGQVEKATGNKYRTEDNPYALMRLSQGLPDAVNQRIEGIADVLKQAPDINSVKLVGMARQILSRDEKGITSTISADKARQVIAEQRAKLGDEGFQKTADVVDAVGDYNKGMLDDLHKAGILSDAALEAINEQGGDYFSKMNVLDKVLENGQNQALFSRSGSFNTTKQAIKKVLAESTGHEEGTQLLDPVESLVVGTNNAMKLIQKQQVYKAFQKLSDDAPDIVMPIRTADQVEEKISLATENAEMRPVRNQLIRTIKANKNGIRRLATQINQLEKKGLNLSLRNGGERMTNQEFDVGGLGGDVATSRAGKGGIQETKNFKMTDSERQLTESLGVKNNPNKLGPKDTASFLRDLIENGSRSDIDRIKKAVGNRDTKMSALVDSLGEIKSSYDDVASKVRANSDRTKELTDASVPEGYALISGYDRGIETKLAVPKEVADVYTGKTPSQQDYLSSIVSKVNGFVKQNFTSNNPTFALLTNPIRDAKSFAYNAKDVKGNPLSIGAALAKGFIARALPEKIGGVTVNKYKDLVDRYVAAGGKSGFYADERAGERLAKDINLEVNGKRSALSLGVKVNEVHSAKDFARELTRVVTAPARAVRDTLHGAGSVLEDTPRVAQFMASLKAGKSDAEAALNARDVTVDFSQAGRVGQTLNAWVPFLNARGQGTIKSIQAIKANPARAAAVYATLTAAPIALLAANNERYKDVMKMIPDQDRDNNFVMVLDDHKDANGNFDHVIKIPKSDVDKTLGNPLEMVFRAMAHDNPDNLQAIITNTVGSLSPVDVVKDDKFNTSRAVGGVLPPFVKAPIENATNHNLYYDSALVPEGKQDLPDRDQVNPNTSTAAKFIGNVTGGSPIKIDNDIRNFTGNLVTESPQDQLGGNFVGANASRMNTEFYKVLNNTSKEKAEVSQQINQAISEGDTDTAQRLATAYNSYLAQQFTPFVKTYRNTLTPELAQLYDKQPIALTRRSVSQRQRNILERQAAQ